MTTPKTSAELESRLNALKKIHAVTAVIFAVIILLWILLGHWKTNLPVFISTVTFAGLIFLVQLAGRRQISTELARRHPEPPKDSEN